MPRQSPYVIELTRNERSQIETMARKYTLPYFLVLRARIVLLAAQGLDNKMIGERLDVSREVVSKWRKRFYERRLDGLQDLPRTGRPPDFSPSGSCASKELSKDNGVRNSA